MHASVEKHLNPKTRKKKDKKESETKIVIKIYSLLKVLKQECQGNLIFVLITMLKAVCWNFPR